MSWMNVAQYATLMVVAYFLICSGVNYYFKTRSKSENGTL